MQVKALMVAAADTAIAGTDTGGDGSVAHQMAKHIYTIIKEELKKEIGGDVYVSDSRIDGFGDGSDDHKASSMHAK